MSVTSYWVATGGTSKRAVSRPGTRGGRSTVESRTNIVWKTGVCSTVRSAPRAATTSSKGVCWWAKAVRHSCRQTPFELRSEEHTSELQSRENLVCRLLLEKKTLCQEYTAGCS